ncbi:hypothetical protein ES708_00728 [subsurface metagenome]
MKKKKVWRYYCDFCKKSGCSGGHISKHEKSCTMNPGRVCGMCKVIDKTQPEMGDMLLALSVAKITETTGGDGDFEWVSYSIANQEEALDNLRNIANGCPACMLAALRQYGHPFVFDKFNFKAERDSVWAGIREDEERRHY